MKVSSITVTDMIGRHVENEHGAQFRIVAVRYDVRHNMYITWLAECDENGQDSGEEESGITTLKGWTLL